MKLRTPFSVIFAALTAFSWPAQAQSTAAHDSTGPYIGAALGPAFGNREIDDANSRNDEGLGRAAKVYAGYQLTEHFGVQAGFVRLHEINQNTGAGSTLVQQKANGQSAYLAGTGRLPLGASFALTGKAGISFGKVTEASPNTAATNALVGSKTSVLISTGAEYVLNRQVLFSAELESYGKLSDRVKGNALMLGARYSF